MTSAATPAEQRRSGRDAVIDGPPLVAAALAIAAEGGAAAASTSRVASYLGARQPALDDRVR